MNKNEDILKRINELIPNTKSNFQNYTASVLKEAADTIEKLRNSKVTCGECKNNYHCIIQDLVEDYGKLPDNPNDFFCYYGKRR